MPQKAKLLGIASLFVLSASLLSLTFVIQRQTRLASKAADEASITVGPNLKYFGYYKGGSTDTDYLSEFAGAGNVNVMQITQWSNSGYRQMLESYREKRIQVMPTVFYLFFTNDKTLYPDWQQRWQKFKSEVLDPYSDVIYALYIDEPAWNEYPQDLFRTVTKHVRDTSPNTRFMIVDGWDAVEKSDDPTYTKRLTPEYLEYVTDVGFDYYFPDWPRYQAGFEKLKTLANKDQRLWLVPEALTFNWQDSSVAADTLRINFLRYLNYANSQPRVVGILPFIYAQFVDDKPENDFRSVLRDYVLPGASQFNSLLASAYTQVGQKIVAQSYPWPPIPEPPSVSGQIPASCSSMQINYSGVSRLVDNLASQNTLPYPPEPGGLVTLNSTGDPKYEFRQYWMRPKTASDVPCNFFILNPSTIPGATLSGASLTFAMPNWRAGLKRNDGSANTTACASWPIDFSSGIVFGVNYRYPGSTNADTNNPWCRNLGPSLSDGQIYTGATKINQSCSSPCAIVATYAPPPAPISSPTPTRVPTRTPTPRPTLVAAPPATTVVTSTCTPQLIPGTTLKGCIYNKVCDTGKTRILIQGWACNPSSPASQYYGMRNWAIGGGANMWLGSVPMILANSQAASYCGGNANHGFKLEVKASDLGRTTFPDSVYIKSIPAGFATAGEISGTGTITCK